MIRTAIILATGLGLCVGAARSSSAATFNDGMTHVIDAVIPEGIVVEDSLSGTPTTVVVTAGAEIGIGGSSIVRDGSRVEISGGTFDGDLSAEGNARILMTDGRVESLSLADASSAEMWSGSIGNVSAHGSSDLTLGIGGTTSDGRGGNTAIGDDATAMLFGSAGGEVLSVSGRARVEIAGATCSDAGVFRDDSVTTMTSGGTFTFGVHVRERAQFNMLGGSAGSGTDSVSASDEAMIRIDGGRLGVFLSAVDASLITVSGTDFNFPLGPLPTDGTLTGLLTDSTPIETIFFRDGTASIVLLSEPTHDDTDKDGTIDPLDNCPSIPNADQNDTDGNGLGDACNDAEDTDGDEWADLLDICPGDFDPIQGDLDGDGFGDACDLCPDYLSTGADFDDNGIGDECECGDQTMDGVVNITDLLAINDVIFGVVPASPLCDANNDGLCNVADILGANAKIFGAPAYCERYPAP